jgi:MFS family permease
MARLWRKVPMNTANLGLAVLAFINLFNYLDRYVVSALVESLKHSEIALTDADLGFLMTGFLLVYMLAAPVFGVLGDRNARPRLIAFGVGCWSLATAASGFAGSYAALLAARAMVGIGEAAYGTIAPSLIADYFPAGQRGRVMAFFFCAIPVGSALGYVVGGLVDAHFGWRAARSACSCAIRRAAPTMRRGRRRSSCRKRRRRPTGDCCTTARMCSRCSAMRLTPLRWAASHFGCRRFSSARAAFHAPPPR